MTSSRRSTCYRHQASTPTSPDLPLRNMTHLLVCKIASLQLPSDVAIETTVAAIEMPAALLMYQLQSVPVLSTIHLEAPALPIETRRIHHSSLVTTVAVTSTIKIEKADVPMEMQKSSCSYLGRSKGNTVNGRTPSIHASH
jgi:hypothetical protein